MKFAVVKRSAAAPRLLKSIPTARLTTATARRIGTGAKSVCIASVVPAGSRMLKRAFPRAQFVGPKTDIGFTTKVDRKTIGADRLANVAAAHARHGRCVLVASFGTATTFDLIDEKGVHLGGAIAPGWTAFAELTSANTAQLPRIDERTPSSMIGRNTRDALRAGVNGGYAALVTGLISGLKKETKSKKVRLVLTGGHAAAVRKLTGLKAVTDPLFTLKGIAILAGAPAREGSK